MCLSSSNKELISNLKGRVSKALNSYKQLEEKEIKCLEEMFEVIDEIIMHNTTFSDREIVDYKTRLLETSSPMARTSKSYIKEHIIPIVNKISTSKWGGKQ